MYLGIQLTPKDPEYQFYSKKNESVKKIRCVWVQQFSIWSKCTAFWSLICFSVTCVWTEKSLLLNWRYSIKLHMCGLLCGFVGIWSLWN